MYKVDTEVHEGPNSHPVLRERQALSTLQLRGSEALIVSVISMLILLSHPLHTGAVLTP